MSRNIISHAIRNGFLGALALLAAACGGSDSGMSSGGGGGTQVTPGNCQDCGTALLTMTDAPGDFLSYTVDITSVQLKKADGTQVQTLPASSRIDFAQLVDLDEVISAGQIPPGEYVAATLGVDYSSASIVVEDSSGASTTVAPVDANGQALTQVQMTVQLDNRNHLRITPRRVSRLSFDLDLQASNVVDLAAHKVTVSPFILASVTPPDTRDTRRLGVLKSVDVAASTYTVDLRPFHEKSREASRSSGDVLVHTTDTTSFEINGQVYAGSAGLTQLAGLTDKPMMLTLGTIDRSEQTFTALRVLAGTSIDDSNRDALSGVVLARSGNSLTVGGVRLDRRDGRFGFEHGAVTVNVGVNTKVTREGQGSGAMGIGDISVGQRIEAMGMFSASGSGSPALDATAGRVRLMYTRISGTVTAAAVGGLTLRLGSIDGRDPSRFNFAGTGPAPAQDADPANYEVATALNVAGIPLSSYTRLFGFVTAFGMAPPDFRAQTFLDFTDTRAGVALTWGMTGSTTPFISMSSTGFAVDLGNAALRGALGLGGQVTDVHTLPLGLMLKGSTEDEAAFAIAHRSRREVENFSSFTDFSAKLTTELTGATALLKLVAEGQFNAPQGVFTARRLLVVLSD